MLNNINILIFNLINGFSNKNIILDYLMIFCAKYLIYIIFITLIILFFYKKRIRKLILLSFISAIIGFLINQLIKLFYFHPRPFILNLGNCLISHSNDSSFPSDHMVIISSITLLMIFINKDKKINILFVILSLFIGFARVFVGVHFPFDILGAVIVSLISSLIVYLNKDFFIKKINIFLI